MAESANSKLSPARLYRAFKTDLAAAWAGFHAAHAKETPYAFVLYGVEGGDPHLTPVMLTEESLTVVAQRYVQKGDDDTVEEARTALRYSIADSPHVRALEQFTSNVAQEFDDHAVRLGDDEGYKVLANAAMKALAELDQEGLFGKGEARNQLLIMVVTEDVEKDWSLPSAKKLNPTEVYDRFRKATEIVGDYASCNALALSSDGTSLYCAGSRNYPTKKSGKTNDLSEVIAFDIQGMRLRRRWTFQFPSFGDSGQEVVLSADGRSFVVLRAQHQDKECHSLLMRFAVESNAIVEQRDIVGAPADFAMAHDDSLAAISMHNKKLVLLDGRLQVIREKEFAFKIYGLHFLKDGTLLVATNEGVWRVDAASGDAQRVIPGRAMRLAVDSQERLLAVSRWFDKDDETKPFGVNLYRFPSFELVRTFDVPDHQCVTCELSPDGTKIAFEIHPIGKYKQSVVVYDTIMGREIARQKSSYLHDLAFFPDSQRLAIAKSEYTTGEPISLWNFADAQQGAPE